MHNRQSRVRHLLSFASADVLGVIVGLAAAYMLRFHAGLVEVTKSYSPATYLRIVPMAAAVWLFWLEATGCYEFRQRAFNLQILKKIFKSTVLAVMTLIVVHFFQRQLEYSRIVYCFTVVTCTAGIGASRLALDRTLAHLRHKGQIPSAKVLILGPTPLGANISERINNHAFLGMRVIGFVSTRANAKLNEYASLPVLGEFGRIREIIREHSADEVIVAQPELSTREILRFVVECDKELVSVRVVPNLLEASLIEMSVEQIDGIPLFALRQSPLQGWNVLLKRAFDIGVSAIVLAFASPLLCLIAIAVKLTSRGPVFYKQKRVGLDGTRFNMYKFRSMRHMAEEATGPIWATADDDRVTPLGSLLRRLNLDELPQFFNVLRGDMSLVGPRPERPHFVKRFREKIPHYMARHRVKSGITGWAQVNGLRGNTSIDERIKFDLYYIENWSLWLDLKILMMTFRAHENAY